MEMEVESFGVQLIFTRIWNPKGIQREVQAGRQPVGPSARPETFIPTHRGHRPLHGLAPWLCPGAVQFESMEGSFQSSQQVSSRAPVVTSVQAARSIPSGMPNQAIAA